MARIYNFSAGPCTLPLSVLESAQAEFVEFEGAGMSLIEMSHRGPQYDRVHMEALARLRHLLSIPDTHDILFLQGGATLQFAMIPMNLSVPGKAAAYVQTGAWAKKAIADAKRLGETKIIWSGADCDFTRAPAADELTIDPDYAYVHITSNETIGGVELFEWPDTGDVPLVADMSSHIMSAPIDFTKVDVVYAGAQKNLGPAGLTVVIIRKDLLERANEEVPAYLAYRTHAPKDSMYNTPPVFAIYMMNKVLEWVEAQGGVSAMDALAQARADLIYGVIDGSDGWYRCPVEPRSRSRMNVFFRLPSADLEKQFIAEATAAGMVYLKGHRAVGGCRASMYNAMPIEGAQALADFMVAFQKKNG
ncbi:3-phosphoserine/phosphohydroxythreonine transaminase [Myxococcota bacterium]|nr:3-phosphoserine/phosphohydroxythreonine transaminase [Myxococcota bacterium]MBU1432108.1 3-phosphoserine/phosphohydroxythreonine transaminase [Myxococcota bacterium]MBU1900687.1 3-phosphoserine/phosphohydroxythreonine transaminase [Myxococcota bacterium]